MTTSKRIPGIGRLKPGALILTHDATRRAGHLLPEGHDGGGGARKFRCQIDAHVTAWSRVTGRPVEVYATAAGRQGWVVDVVTAPGPDDTSETEQRLGYMQGRGAA